MHQLSQDGGNDVPLHPMRLFQNEIAQVTNPVEDIFSMPLTAPLHIGDSATGAHSENNSDPPAQINLDNSEIPGLDNVSMAQNIDAMHLNLENYAPARIVANTHITNPRVRGTGNRPPTTRPVGRQPHPQHPNLLYCTKSRHYVRSDIFGPDQFRTCNACCEKDRQRAHRARQNAQILSMSNSYRIR